jgi:hypothetical protein
MWFRGLVGFIAGAVAIALAVTLRPSSGVSDVAHKSVQFQLAFTGQSIYEYRTKTGKWPAQIDDLAMTSLPIMSPYWKYELDNELIVVVWHKNLKSDPRENTGHILAYYNKGLISELGQSWVCWGDLRTEYIKTEDLRAYLKNLKE